MDAGTNEREGHRMAVTYLGNGCEEGEGCSKSIMGCLRLPHCSQKYISSPQDCYLGHFPMCVTPCKAAVHSQAFTGSQRECHITTRFTHSEFQ